MAASAGDGGWEGWDGSVGGVVVGGWVGGSIRGVGMVLGPLMERCASGRGARGPGFVRGACSCVTCDEVLCQLRLAECWRGRSAQATPQSHTDYRICDLNLQPRNYRINIKETRAPICNKIAALVPDPQAQPGPRPRPHSSQAPHSCVCSAEL